MDVIPKTKTKTPGCGSRFWSKESGHTGTQQVANWGESGEYWSDWVLIDIWNIWYSIFCLFLDWILERSRWIMIVYLRFFGYWGSHLFSKHGRSLLGGFFQSGLRGEMNWGSFPAGWFGRRHTWIFIFTHLEIFDWIHGNYHAIVNENSPKSCFLVALRLITNVKESPWSFWIMLLIVLK